PPGTGRRLTEAMECLFPGSSTVPRRFEVHTVELTPGEPATVAGVRVTGWQVEHPSGAPALALRLGLGGRIIAYTGDTAWTDVLLDAADGASLLVAEAYRMDKSVPYHLRHADLAAHRHLLTSDRVVLTHLGAEVLSRQAELSFEAAHDGLVLEV
ncbi:MAG: MBL fold metallo-hydrolase, partial [Streptosporangiaceae bacterium]